MKFSNVNTNQSSVVSHRRKPANLAIFSRSSGLFYQRSAHNIYYCTYLTVTREVINKHNIVTELLHQKN